MEIWHPILSISESSSLYFQLICFILNYIETNKNKNLSFRYALYNMKTCLPRKTARPRSVEHFYSSGPRPTLRMVDGDIVVVSTNGTNAKALRHQPIEEDQSTLEMSNESQNHTQITRTDSPSQPRQKSIERTEPEIPFHLITPPEMQTATMSSGKWLFWCVILVFYWLECVSGILLTGMCVWYFIDWNVCLVCIVVYIKRTRLTLAGSCSFGWVLFPAKTR